MTSLTSLLRDHTADPQPDRMPRIAAVVEREGRAAEFLDSLRDCDRWKAQPSTSQDIAAAVVGSRLGAGFEWVGMEEFSATLTWEQDTGGQTPWGDWISETMSETMAHRLARFRHRATGAVMHLVPGLACSVCSGTGRLASFDATHAGPSRYLGSITCPDCPERLVAPFLVGQTPVTIHQWNQTATAEDYERAGKGHLPITGRSHETIRRWLSACGFTGAPLGLRLPSPAEWRHAAYAGATTRWPWGDEWLPEGDRLVWHAGNSGDDRLQFCDGHNQSEAENDEIQDVRWCRGCFADLCALCREECPDPHPPSFLAIPHPPNGERQVRNPRLHPVTDHLDARAWNAFGLVDCIGNVDEWLAVGRVVGGNYHDGFVGFDDAVTPEPHELGSIGFRAFASVPGVE